MAELVDAYLDLPLGIVDAAVIAIAENVKHMISALAGDDLHRALTDQRPADPGYVR